MIDLYRIWIFWLTIFDGGAAKCVSVLSHIKSDHRNNPTHFENERDSDLKAPEYGYFVSEWCTCYLCIDSRTSISTVSYAVKLDSVTLVKNRWGNIKPTIQLLVEACTQKNNIHYLCWFNAGARKKNTFIKRISLWWCCVLHAKWRKEEKKNEFPIRVIPLTVNVSDVFNRMKMQSKRYGRIFFYYVAAPSKRSFSRSFDFQSSYKLLFR